MNVPSEAWALTEYAGPLFQLAPLRVKSRSKVPGNQGAKTQIEGTVQQAVP